MTIEEGIPYINIILLPYANSIVKQRIYILLQFNRFLHKDDI